MDISSKAGLLFDKMEYHWPIQVPESNPFTLDNIPFGIFSTQQRTAKRAGTAIGKLILDLSIIERSGLLRDCLFEDNNECGSSDLIFGRDTLNDFARLPRVTRRRVRQNLIDWLRDPTSPLFTDAVLNKTAFVPIEDARMHMPFSINGFTDFMCADVHVDNCSRLAGAATPPAHYAMPLGYNARASSVITGDEPIHRPRGIIRDAANGKYSFLLTHKMDYEAELGIFVAEPVSIGETLTADQAEDHIFGFAILNDWSARDIQFAEMTPLGPLNGKAFATTISPWVITLDALQSVRCASTVADLSVGGRAQAHHLCHVGGNSTWDLEVEVSVYRTCSGTTKRILSSRSNLWDLRWSPGQMLAHLASSGCGLRTGDLIGTGTISSPNDSASLRTLGCLLELTEGGKISAADDGEQQLFWLEDGDEVVMTVWAGRSAGRGILGLGTLRSRVLGPRVD